MNNKSPIGVFDSGIGGLTVLKELQRHLPHEDFIYFADLAYVPYGTKSEEDIISYAHRIMSFMQQKNVKLVVAACHTCSAIAIDSLLTPFPIIGTVYPMVENFTSLGDRIGIIATPATTSRRFHEQALHRAGFKGFVTTISCEQFVPLIESGDLNSASLKEYAGLYLKPFFEESLTTLIYGCTHYPLIASLIESLLPSSVTCIDPAQFITLKAGQILREKNLTNPQKNDGSLEFYTSGQPSQLAASLQRFFPPSFSRSSDFLGEEKIPFL